MRIAELLQEGEKQLLLCGVRDAAIDVQLLLGHCLKKNRSELFLHSSDMVDSSCCNRFLTLIERRAAREPVAYILKEREFWSLPFYVNQDVLIPRPETEFLLEMVLQQLAQTKTVVNHCVDLCCGSGVIAVVLARELGCFVTALDYSEKALAVTARNSQRHGVDERVTPLHSDVFGALPVDAVFPLIVSNPPYVCSAAIRGELDAEVAAFEPHLA
ncbi:MAG: HemK/PrmC family methyltransferase, partial [Desulfopila sp.]|nr:HemK/PrmC family methyltransferase [Desulfopila sp.]